MRNTYNHILRAITLVLLVSLLSSCVAKKSIPLRIGLNNWIGYQPLFLAKEIGILDHNRIQLIEYPSTSGVILSLKNNLIEAGGLTLDEALVLNAQNNNVKAVLVMDISNGADSFIVNKKKIKTFKELEGKTIGYEETATGAYMAQRLFDKLTTLRVDSRKIKTKNVEYQNHYSKLVDGSVDAIITFEPTRTKLLKEIGTEMFSSKEIPNEILDVLVVNEDQIEIQKENIKYLVEVWNKVNEYIKKNPESSMVPISNRIQMSTEEAQHAHSLLKIPSYSENRSLLLYENAQIRTNIELYKKLLDKKNINIEQKDFKNLFLQNLDEYYIK